MKQNIRMLLSLLFAVFLVGCATTHVAPAHSDITPELFNDHGIVVGQLTTISIDKRLGHKGELKVEHMEDNEPWIFGKVSNSEKHTHVPQVRSLANQDGFIDLAYPEGSYNIVNFKWKDIGREIKYPFNIHFDVKKNTITNLGHILVLFDPNKSNGYYIIIVDNEYEMETYLQENYLDQYKAMKGDFKVRPKDDLQVYSVEMGKSILEQMYGEFTDSLPDIF